MTLFPLSRRTNESLALTCFVLGVLILDQWSKEVVFSWLRDAGSPQALTPFLNFVTVWNYGISFGLFQNLELGKHLFSGLAAGICVALMYWLSREPSLLLRVAISAVIAGAIGNVIDRIRFGAVADFIDLHWAGYHWPAFNVADSAVCLGVCVLLVAEFFPRKR